MTPETGAGIRLPADGRAPSLARRRVREVVDSAGPSPGMIDLASLLVSELVGNAVLHATPPATLTCTCRDAALRLEVTDSSPQPPAVGEAGPTDTGGRGMRLVEVLSSRWGVELTAHGKLVWAEIDPEDAAAYERGDHGAFTDGTPPDARPT